MRGEHPFEPLLAPELEHIQNIRIGTKSVSYWPQRFVTDKDADDLMRLFEKVVASGKNLALMGHYNHPVELRQDIAQQAVRRIVSSGVSVAASIASPIALARCACSSFERLGSRYAATTF